MSRAHGQIRSGQVITTYGPGALIDLPSHSAIVGGLDTWPKTANLSPYQLQKAVLPPWKTDLCRRGHQSSDNSSPARAGRWLRP